MSELRERLIKEDGVKGYMKHLATVLDKEEAIVLFGAGTGGVRFWEWAKANLKNKTKNIWCFIDNNASKWGTVFPKDGVVVKSPESFLRCYRGRWWLLPVGKGMKFKDNWEKLGGGYCAAEP